MNSRGNNALMDCIEAGTFCTDFLDVDLNYQNCNSETALHISVKEGLLKVLDALLAGGANPNIRNKRGCSPLMEAAMIGSSDLIARLITDEVCDVNLFESNGCSALCLAIHCGSLDSVVLLVEKGDADINHSMASGETPLLLGCKLGYFEIARYLLRKGAKCDAINKAGSSILLFAAYLRNVEAVSDWVKLVDVNGIDNNGVTALMAVCGGSLGSSEIVDILIKNKASLDPQSDFLGDTALTLASWNGLTTSVELLLAAGADPNLQKSTGCTALHLAIHNNFFGIVLLFSLDKRTKMDIQNDAGLCVLLCSICFSSIEITSMLLDDSRVQLNLRNTDLGTKALKLSFLFRDIPTSRMIIPHLLSNYPHLNLYSDWCDDPATRQSISLLIREDTEEDIGTYFRLLYSNNFAPGLPLDIKSSIVSLAFGLRIIMYGPSRGIMERIKYVLVGDLN